MRWFEYVYILGGYGILEAAKFYLYENARIRRIEKRATASHIHLEEALRRDSREQLERLQHAMKNHMQGPGHRS